MPKQSSTKHFITLFRLLELTRAQVQQGYILAEIPKHELSDLAQHHYLVTFIAWQLARQLVRSGAKIDVEKVLEYALAHDLGELFGGDIAMPYAKANPVARTAAKAFERENQKYLARFFAADSAYFDALSKEILDASADEALIVKIADYIEVTHYKMYVRRLSKGDITMAGKQILAKIEKIKDKKAQKTLRTFAREWTRGLSKNSKPGELFEHAK